MSNSVSSSNSIVHKIDQKLAELSNTAPWSDEMVYLMQIPGFGLLTSMILLAAVGASGLGCGAQ